MGNASDFMQIASTVQQWGFWATVAVVSTLLLLKIIWGFVKEYFSEFRSNQRYNKESLQILREAAKVGGSDPPEYVGLRMLVEYDQEILERLDRNRDIWLKLPDEIARRCSETGCPFHSVIKEDVRKFHDEVKENTKIFHANATRYLEQFVKDAAVARAETMAAVKGIEEDVKTLHHVTIPTIEHVVGLMSQRESEHKKDGN